MLAATGARAQQPSKADLDKARSLFREGVACQAANNWTCALDKYMAVIKVKSTPQVAFNIAECEERLGKLTEALGNYRIAASQVEGKTDDPVAKAVPTRIEDLEARIPKLTIKRGRGAEAAKIEIDGQELGQTQLGDAMALDPGPHTIVARVGDKEHVRETLTLAEKDQKTFVVKIDLPAPVVKDEPPPETEKPPPPTPSRAPGIVLTVGGGVLLITGLAMLGPRASAISQLSKDCNPTTNECPPSDSSVGSSGKLYTGLTEVFVPVGVAAAVVGIVLLVKSAPPKDDKKSDGDEKKDGDKKDAFWRSLDVAAWAPGASVGGISLTGRF
jgi:hypothetical protein